VTRLLVGLRAILYVAGFVLLWGWLAVNARRYDAALGGPLPPWLHALGLVCIAWGALIVGTCVVFFVARGWGTPAPFDPPRQFVAVGPYRWVRNPMYVGGVLVLVGFGMWQRSPGIVLLALVGMLAAHLFVTLVEEPGLARRFGDSYREYTRTVRRWLPKWS
jgi:protein-S-isoprenylcysteine O-methyltransferase Ste14